LPRRSGSSCTERSVSEKVAVSLKRLYGKQRTVTEGGTEQQVTVDAAYLANA
jgi:hypothetical protein